MPDFVSCVQASQHEALYHLATGSVGVGPPLAMGTGMLRPEPDSFVSHGA